MRIVSTMCISKEKAVRHYVDLIVIVFEENSEITQGWGERDGFECQLRTSKSEMCFQGMRGRREDWVGVQNLHYFCGCYK